MTRKAPENEEVPEQPSAVEHRRPAAPQGNLHSPAPFCTPRRKRHPVVSLLVIVLSVYAMVSTREDFCYFFAARQPRNLGSAAEVVQRGLPAPNSYVRVSGAPDRTHSLILDNRLGGSSRFFRLLQTGSLLYVEQPRPKDETKNFVGSDYRGRLQRLDSLSYSTGVRDYFARTVTTAHDFPPEGFIRELNQGGVFTDRSGARIPLAADQICWIDIGYPDEWVVQLSKQRYPALDDAKHELTNFSVAFTVDPDPSDLFWRLVTIGSPEQLRPLAQYLSAPEKNSSVVHRHVSYSVPLHTLSATADGQLLMSQLDANDMPPHYRRVAQGPRGHELEPVVERPLHIPAAALLHISTASSFSIPRDAMIILADKAPADFWYYAVVWTLLVAFLVLNGWALMGYLRSRFSSDSQSTAP